MDVQGGRFWEYRSDVRRFVRENLADDLPEKSRGCTWGSGMWKETFEKKKRHSLQVNWIRGGGEDYLQGGGKKPYGELLGGAKTTG